MNTDKPGLKSKVEEELKKTLLIFLYLFVFLGTFETYRRLLLAEYGISYLHYGSALLEAMILSKLIMLGSALRLGDRFKLHPLFVPVLYKTICFSLFLLVFDVTEHVVIGLFNGRSLGATIGELLAPGMWEILTRVMVKVLALAPLFAIWEVGKALGEGTLYEMVFTDGKLQVTRQSGSTEPQSPR